MKDFDPRLYLSIFLRRLWLFVLSVTLVTAVGVFLILRLPPLYLAEARILVESPRISVDLARSSVPSDAIEQVQILEQQLETRASLLAMAEKFGIYRGDRGIQPEEIVKDMRGRTSVEPIQFYTPSGSIGALAFAISFEADDPVLAANVANDYAMTIVQTNLRQRRERAGEAQQFFTRDVERLAGVLAKAQNAISHFNNENQNALPEGLAYRQMQLSSFEEALRQLERESASLRNRRTALQQIAADPNRPIDSSAPTADEQTLMDLRRGLAEQQAVFTEDSPNLKQLRSRIAALEEQLLKQRSTILTTSANESLPPELKMQLAEIDGQLELNRQEKEALRSRLGTLEQTITESAQNATILNTLQQDYQAVLRQYTDARTRLTEASTGERIEAQAIGEKLTLIEKAVPPLKPVKPKRRALAGAAVLAGAGLGLALILLLEMWNPTIRRPSQLAAIFEGQPIVSVPYIFTRQQVLRRRLAYAGLTIAIAACVPVLFLAKNQLANTSVPESDSVPIETPFSPSM